MKIFQLWIVGTLLFMGQFYFGWYSGKRSALAKIPSCVYIQRPSMNDIKPLGYDNHEGVDADFDRIEGGGYYISLEKWKRQ